MKCQYCNKNEAINTFLVSFFGGQQEIHLCESCTQLGRQYYDKLRMANPGMFRGNGAPAGGNAGGAPYPDDAGEEIRRRRRLNVLKARLEQAVEKEQYEEAARIRDQIARSQGGGAFI